MHFFEAVLLERLSEGVASEEQMSFREACLFVDNTDFFCTRIGKWLHRSPGAPFPRALYSRLLRTDYQCQRGVHGRACNYVALMPRRALSAYLLRQSHLEAINNFKATDYLPCIVRNTAHALEIQRAESHVRGRWMGVERGELDASMHEDGEEFESVRDVIAEVINNTATMMHVQLRNGIRSTRWDEVVQCLPIQHTTSTLLELACESAPMGTMQNHERLLRRMVEVHRYSRGREKPLIASIFYRTFEEYKMREGGSTP